MEEIFLKVFKHIGLGLLGLLVFAVWSVREKIGTQFSFKRLYKENKPFWVWSAVMLTLLVIVIEVSPESSGALKTITGMDLSSEPAAFISTGMALGGIANSLLKKKINQKPKTIE